MILFLSPASNVYLTVQAKGRPSHSGECPIDHATCPRLSLAEYRYFIMIHPQYILSMISNIIIRSVI